MAGKLEPERTPGDAVVVALFALMLLAPALLALTGHAGFDTAFIESGELRHPFVAPPPTKGALATGGWQRDAEREIADAFPLRRTLIEAYDHAKYAWLHDVASSHVVKGRDGWLFFGDEELQYVTGAARPSDAELTSLADVYAARDRWCRRRGIAYVFLLAPNKSTVYAEDLPAGITRATPTIADRLLPLMRARGVRVVDVRAELHGLAQAGAGREIGDVYSRGDTHWNDAGAYAAYRATVGALAGARSGAGGALNGGGGALNGGGGALNGAGVRDAILRTAIVTRVETGEGDLLKLAGIASLVPNRIVRYDFPKRAHAVGAPVYANDPGAAAFIVNATAVDAASRPAPLPVGIVFGDSFTDALRPFLAEDFRRLVVLRHVNVTDVQFDRHVLDVEKPAVVIQELAERSLVFGAQFHDPNTTHSSMTIQDTPSKTR